ncbi:MAG: hypothetical protein NT098_03395 [Candidatus Parcubacteria bacterium]|nr:hypothetical protein [Candidatus Parcubacteria bacterium]
MESLLKSDIFFFVTTICIFAVTVLLLMILMHVLHIVRKARKYVDCLTGEVDGFLKDFSDLRAILRENQFGFKPIFEAIKTKTEAFTAKAKPRKKPKITEDKV